ncbi:MAG TPA: AI-2E family transporter [Beijerinckiaceae bacterium]|nr:AI-2E family transporter [Beijerinckiaceae bacterium]
MRLEQQIAFWAAALLLLVVVLWLLGGVLLPFAAALILGYLLDPVADRLEELGLNRLGAALVILALFLLGLVLILVLVAPILAHQLTGFLANLPSYIAKAQTLASEQGAQLAERWGGGFFNKIGGPASLHASDLQKSIGDFVGQALQWLIGVARGLWTGGQALLGLFSLLVVTPVVTFYILLDWRRMVATVDRWVPLDHRETVRELAREMDAALAGFLRGQSLVCLFLGLWYGIGLSLVGLNFGLLIGISAGVLSFVPYVGSLTALFVAALVALVQGWPHWTLLMEAIGVVVVGQFLEGNILSPWLVGSSIGLHPVWLMFALLSFGSLFGFTGLILAVPVAAASGVLLRFALRHYLASPIYRGADLPARDEIALITDSRADSGPNS